MTTETEAQGSPAAQSAAEALEAAHQAMRAAAERRQSWEQERAGLPAVMEAAMAAGDAPGWMRAKHREQVIDAEIHAAKITEARAHRDLIARQMQAAQAEGGSIAQQIAEAREQEESATRALRAAREKLAGLQIRLAAGQLGPFEQLSAAYQNASAHLARLQAEAAQPPHEGS